MQSHDAAACQPAAGGTPLCGSTASPWLQLASSCCCICAGRSLAGHGHSLSRGSESSLQAAAAHLSRPGSPRTPANLRRSGSSLEPKPPAQPAAQLTAPVPLPQGPSPARLSRLASTETGAASPTRPPASKAGAGQVRGGAAEPSEVPAQPGSVQPGASLHASVGQVLPRMHPVPASLSPFAVAASQPAGDHADHDQGPTRHAGVADHPLSEPGSFKTDADLHSLPHLAGAGLEAGDAGLRELGRPQSGRPAQARVTGEAAAASPAPSLLRPVAGHLPPKHPPAAGDAAGDSPSKPAAAAATHDAIGAEWQLLLCPEQLDFRHTLEDEAPGMPWARAKFQVGCTSRGDCVWVKLSEHCLVSMLLLMGNLPLAVWSFLSQVSPVNRLSRECLLQLSSGAEFCTAWAWTLVQNVLHCCSA